MRLHRFFVEEKLGGQSSVLIGSKELAHQIRHVFRLKEGDHIIVFNGDGLDHECRIGSVSTTSSAGKDPISLDIVSSVHSDFMPAREIVLCAAVVKKDNFEFIVQKATELGVSKVIPILSERSEKKLLNFGRLNKITVEASEQSGRGDVVTILDIMDVASAINFLKDKGVSSIIVFHTDGGVSPKKIIDNIVAHNQPVAVFIGPEGGWSPEEIDTFRKNNVEVVSLGSQILRAETAAIATLSLLVFG